MQFCSTVIALGIRQVRICVFFLEPIYHFNNYYANLSMRYILVKDGKGLALQQTS